MKIQKEQVGCAACDRLDASIGPTPGSDARTRENHRINPMPGRPDVAMPLLLCFFAARGSSTERASERASERRTYVRGSCT
jgi:hypothetical protein